MRCGGFIVLLDGRLVYLDTLCLDDCLDLIGVSGFICARLRGTNSLLESDKVRWAQSIRLCYNRNEVNTGTEAPHDFDVKRLECVTRRTDEVKACVDSKVDLVYSAWLLLLQHVRLVLIVQELDNGHP